MSDRGTVTIYRTVPQATIAPIEKKGLGHPDAICDALAERISAAYSRFCYENFGVIVPHTIDGLTMDEGVSSVEFGKGEMVRPIRLYLRGSFSVQYMDKKIPYVDIAKKTIYDYLGTILPTLDAERWIRVIDGTQVYAVPKRIIEIDKLIASHMYVVTAHYPPTIAETNALHIEQMLNSPSYKKENPFVGSDNKIIYIQNGNSVDIEAYVSMIADMVPSESALRAYSEKVKNDIRECATTGRIIVKNTDVYCSDDAIHDARVLTATGSSVENSNGGAIGHSRYPVYHAAKIYSQMAYRIAKRIHNEEHITSSVTLTSKVGWPMSTPWRSFIELYGTQGNVGVSPALWSRIEGIAKDEFAKDSEIIKDLMYGKTKSN